MLADNKAKIYSTNDLNAVSTVRILAAIVGSLLLASKEQNAKFLIHSSHSAIQMHAYCTLHSVVYLYSHTRCYAHCVLSVVCVLYNYIMLTSCSYMWQQDGR